MIRDAINSGDILGPRCLANGQEMAKRDGELVGGITAFANGQMRCVKCKSHSLLKEYSSCFTFGGLRIREHVELGVDQIKLSRSGESVRYEPRKTSSQF